MNHIDPDGTLHTEDGLTVLRFERHLAHPAAKVWHALTDAEALRHWFPQDVTADLRPGGKMLFTFRESGDYGGIPPFEGEVLECEPPRVLAYRWGTDLLRWELQPTGDGCLLIFTDTLTERGKAARDGAGWHVCLDALQAWVDGAEPPAADRWQQVHPGYVELFGPEAATIGPPPSARR
jgi:uncharacterized protein YndB with AHSA1/START domain